MKTSLFLYVGRRSSMITSVHSPSCQILNLNAPQYPGESKSSYSPLERTLFINFSSWVSEARAARSQQSPNMPWLMSRRLAPPTTNLAFSRTPCLSKISWKKVIENSLSVSDLFSTDAQKVMSNSLGLVDFAIGLVIFFFAGRVLFLGEIQITEG